MVFKAAHNTASYEGEDQMAIINATVLELVTEGIKL